MLWEFTRSFSPYENVKYEDNRSWRWQLETKLNRMITKRKILTISLYISNTYKYLVSAYVGCAHRIRSLLNYQFYIWLATGTLWLISILIVWHAGVANCSCVFFFLIYAMKLKWESLVLQIGMLTWLSCKKFPPFLWFNSTENQLLMGFL